MNQLFSSHTQMDLIEGSNIFKEYKVNGKLGAGNSTVYSVYKQGDPNEKALKEIVIKFDQDYVDFMREVNLMKDICKQNHPNIISFYDYCILERQSEFANLRLAYILLEKGITSMDRLVLVQQEKQLYFQLSLIKDFMKKSIEVHRFLQDRKIAHCDIKPENILIMDVESIKFKICDIGSGKIIKNENTQTQTISGTIPFLSPELLKGIGKNRLHHNAFKSDVFSLGLCFLYLMTFNRFTSQQRLSLIDDEVFMDVVNEWVSEAKAVYDNDEYISYTLNLMLNLDQSKRPDFTQLEQITSSVEQVKLDKINHSPVRSKVSPIRSKQNSPQRPIVFNDMGNSQIIKEQPRKFLNQFTIKTKRPLKNSQSQLSMQVQTCYESDGIFKVQQFNQYAQGQGKQILQPTIKITQLPNTIRLSTPNINLQSPKLSSSSKIQINRNHIQTKSQFFLPHPHAVTSPEKLQFPRQTNQIKKSPNFTHPGRKLQSQCTQQQGGRLTPIEYQSTKSSFNNTDSPLILHKRFWQQKQGLNFRIVDNHEELLEVLDNADGQFEMQKGLIISLRENESQLNNIAGELYKLAQVQELCLIVKAKDKPQGKDYLGEFVERLKQMSQLNNLEFILECLDMNINIRETNNNLKTLSVQFNKCKQQSTDQIDILRFLNPFLKPSLNNLFIGFNQCHFNNHFELCQSIQLSQNLQNIELNFSNVIIEEKPHKRLYECISKLPNLQIMNFSFLSCQINLKQTQLNFNTHLSQLHLNYDNTQLDQFMTSIALGIQSQTKLEVLYLGLNHQKIQIKIFKLLIEYIRKLPNLKDINISMNDIFCIDDQVFHYLMEKLKNLHAIEVMKLSLVRCNLTQAALISLKVFLNSLKNGKLLQFEYLGPRLSSIQHCKELIKYSKQEFEIYVNQHDTENYRIILVNQTRLLAKYSTSQQIQQCCSQEYELLFECLDCKTVPRHQINFCGSCLQSCHLGHSFAIVSQFQNRKGLLSKKIRCSCQFDGCGSGKKANCTSVFGKQLTQPRMYFIENQIISPNKQRCKTCDPQIYICQYCVMTKHQDHLVEKFEYVTEFECGKQNKQ